MFLYKKFILIKPYNNINSGKKAQVALMFNKIARRYDFFNHLFSLGRDKYWRRRAIKILKELFPKKILDLATGTGDFAIEAMKLNPEKIIGIDISYEMLKIGKEKIKKKQLENIIELQEGDCENINFSNNSFDAVIIAFGIRNFENPAAGLKEMNRVLKPGGTVIILEFSKPTIFPVKQLYNFYFLYILPFFGRLFSKDKFAYSYLPESVYAFYEGKNFLIKLEQSGFIKTKHIPLSFGIASIYIGQKRT